MDEPTVGEPQSTAFRSSHSKKTYHGLRVVSGAQLGRPHSADTSGAFLFDDARRSSFQRRSRYRSSPRSGPTTLMCASYPRSRASPVTAPLTVTPGNFNASMSRTVRASSAMWSRSGVPFHFRCTRPRSAVEEGRPRAPTAVRDASTTTWGSKPRGGDPARSNAGPSSEKAGELGSCRSDPSYIRAFCHHGCSDVEARDPTLAPLTSFRLEFPLKTEQSESGRRAG